MNYEIIIVGFGTAGALAAIAAARTGASVLVLEKSSYPGGMQTGGLISEYCYQKPEGVTAELETACTELMAGNGYALPIEAKKLVLENSALNAGCDIRYEVTVSGVIMDGSVVKGIIWLENDLKYKAEASVIIDASAEAIVCLLSGCEFSSGRDLDGKYQHSNVIFEFLKEKSFYSYAGVPLRINQENVKDFSRASLEATSAILSQNNENMRLTAPSDRHGIREGRHIIPEKLYKMDDVILSEDPVAKPITYAYSQFDTNITDPMLESESFQDWMIAATLWGTKLWIAVPEEVLFPKNIKGLMVAGRHLGVDHDCGHALRMNATMSCIGAVAGSIAATAVRYGIMPDILPYKLVEQIVDLPDSPLSENRIIWDLEDDAIIQELNSNTPGRGIWSAYRRRRRSLLHNVLANSEPGSLKHSHAAFALALLRSPEAVPILRVLVETRDNTQQCSLSFDYGIQAPSITVRHGCIAIYLLGRFSDAGSIELLDRVLADPRTVDRDYYLAYTIVSLLKIGDKHPEHRERIADILFCRVIAIKQLSVLFRFIKYAEKEYDVAFYFKELIEDTLVHWNIDIIRKATVM